ncbi:structural toxin protein (hemagglutinin/hemolysin) RtxA [Legionella lansingensis]|uniref:Structural toxin protein (Hemagglutinin/hemolysin) RtxA n=1 Tax=Legionella lansingensis TaxID=45067 RepID=A0A0W0VJK6_9GAMM|nr:YqfO family protein [Legionella lansingensis]KTD20274.1 structural toxin protein (hemagglutinin/hemolysin) RtxA [Legionella lansingensis]SNV50285.1 structural toxin protein (hemagglutinin/hemolysin) RtxA [Legionella lansingensis]
MERVEQYKLAFYVPESHLDQVKQALFNAGAGRQGDYEQCCWQCLGQGQFKPLTGANPTIGHVETLTFVPEYKVEMVCSAANVKHVVQALRANHPYEEPAFEVVRLENY